MGTGASVPGADIRTHVSPEPLAGARRLRENRPTPAPRIPPPAPSSSTRRAKGPKPGPRRPQPQQPRPQQHHPPPPASEPKIKQEEDEDEEKDDNDDDDEDKDDDDTMYLDLPGSGASLAVEVLTASKTESPEYRQLANGLRRRHRQRGKKTTPDAKYQEVVAEIQRLRDERPGMLAEMRCLRDQLTYYKRECQRLRGILDAHPELRAPEDPALGRAPGPTPEMGLRRPDPQLLPRPAPPLVASPGPPPATAGSDGYSRELDRGAREDRAGSVAGFVDVRLKIEDKNEYTSPYQFPEAVDSTRLAPYASALGPHPSTWAGLQPPPPPPPPHGLGCDDDDYARELETRLRFSGQHTLSPQDECGPGSSEYGEAVNYARCCPGEDTGLVHGHETPAGNQLLSPSCSPTAPHRSWRQTVLD